jgi:hypothetical protein
MARRRKGTDDPSKYLPSSVATPLSPAIEPQPISAESITTGTLSTDRFSAYSDLTAESKIGTGAAQVAAGDHTHAGLVTNGDSHDHSGGDGGTIAYSSLSGTPVQSKSLTLLTPTSSDDISLWQTATALTITRLAVVLTGSTPSVTWTLRHGTDRNATGTEVVTGGTTTTATTTPEVITSFNDATVDANAFIWFETTAKSGTVNSLSLTVEYS